MPANYSPRHNIDICCALAYLFQHPEIDSHIERPWNSVDEPVGQHRYVFTVDREVMDKVLILLAGTAVRPIELPRRQRYAEPRQDPRAPGR